MQAGEFYTHPTRSDWGIGRVLEVNGDKVSVNFEHVGLKTLNVSIVKLEKAISVAAIPIRIDVQRLKFLCRRFHSDQEHVRRGSNLGSMALKVLEEVERRGSLTETTRKQLLAWCYTEGYQYQSGIALAREICITIYGRVLPDRDKG